MTLDERLDLHRLPGPQDAHVLGGVAEGDRLDRIVSPASEATSRLFLRRRPALSTRGDRQKEAERAGGGRISRERQTRAKVVTLAARKAKPATGC